MNHNLYFVFRLFKGKKLTDVFVFLFAPLGRVDLDNFIAVVTVEEAG